MITIDSIIEAYKVARRNKRYSPDQVDFELHWEANCLKLYEDVISRSVRPSAYTFITDYPKPREVFASDMATRVLHHYLDIRLRPLLELRLSPHTFNNRVGKGQKACQNALITDIYEVTKGFTQDAYIIKIDMSGCFPNIVQDIAYAQLKAVIDESYYGDDKEDLLYILSVCVYSFPTHHCYRKSQLRKWNDIAPHKSLFNKPDGIGAAIGHLIWQNAVNYYFHEIDEWLIELGIHFERFVDDFVFVVINKTAFLAYVLPELRVRLHNLGASLNENKFYCQYYAKGTEWVGSHIKRDRIYVNNRTVHRGMIAAHKHNRHIKPSYIDKMLSSINSYLGFCKTTNGYNRALKITNELSPKWKRYVTFNRRRVCFQVKFKYSLRNRIINKYKLCKL